MLAMLQRVRVMMARRPARPARGDPLDHSGEGRLLERQGRMSTPPGDRGQLDFLQQVQRIFDEGEFVATYKFALLIALVELGNRGQSPIHGAA